MLSEKMKKRFCKDNNLSINVFTEPYFRSRLDLCDELENYDDFERMIQTDFNGDEESYFESYNAVKDSVINFIKASDAYNSLQTACMNTLNYKGVSLLTQYEYSDRDVYKAPLVGQYFVSLDIRSANYTALRAYGDQIGHPFDTSSSDYDGFIRHFTDNQHIIKSKYIRQVVFGNCNPKRQVHYEKCMNLYLLNELLKAGLICNDDIFSVKHDEIILKPDRFIKDNSLWDKFLSFIGTFNTSEFPVRCELFRLGRVEEEVSLGESSTEPAYFKQLIKDIRSINTIDQIVHPSMDWQFKCVNPDRMSFIYRRFKGQDPDDKDLVFSHNGLLAKFLETPRITFSFAPKQN